MRGRGDIFVGFFERSLRMLTGWQGRLHMRRPLDAKPVRRSSASSSPAYAVEHVWTMHDVDAFEEQVSAYPAITVLGNHAQGSAVVADTTTDFGAPARRAGEASRTRLH